MSVSRRDVLRSLSIGAAATSVLRVIPLQAAEYAHHMIDSEKASSKAGIYTPKYFTPQQYKTLQALCESIFPADTDCGGATEAGATGATEAGAVAVAVAEADDAGAVAEADDADGVAEADKAGAGVPPATGDAGDVALYPLADAGLEGDSALAIRTPTPSAAPVSSVTRGMLGFMPASTQSRRFRVQSHPRTGGSYCGPRRDRGPRPTSRAGQPHRGGEPS